MNTYKHSGALGDLIYGMVVPKYTGGGHFYLHLNQLDWIGQHYYGNQPGGFHQGRMTQKDFEYMKPFMEAQEYITGFDILDPNRTEISHNLDRFRPPFVMHPANYIDLYSEIFKLYDNAELANTIKTEPWLTVPNPRTIEGRPIVINRTSRWVPTDLSGHWNHWKNNKGWEAHSVFVGLELEYANFCQITGWNIPWQPTANMLELAEYIAGSSCFIGNQSQCLALAIGLGVADIRCEARRDLPLERNECYFAQRRHIEYF